MEIEELEGDPQRGTETGNLKENRLEDGPAIRQLSTFCIISSLLRLMFVVYLGRAVKVRTNPVNLSFPALVDVHLVSLWFLKGGRSELCPNRIILPVLWFIRQGVDGAQNLDKVTSIGR